MKCLMFDKENGISEIEVPVPEIGPGEALIQVLRVGICNTDLEILNGYAGYEGILGHEFLGRISRLPEGGSNGGFSVGQRVVGDINIPCGRCHICLQMSGSLLHRYHCPQRTVLGIVNRPGSWSEYLVLPLANLHLVPESVTDEDACFAEPLAAACKLVSEQKLVHKDQLVCVIGDGKLGLLCCDVIHALVPDVKRRVLIGRHKHKMSLAGDAWEQFEFSDMTTTLFGDYFDVVIEATGKPAGLMAAVGMCRPMGTLVLKTTCASSANEFSSTMIVVKELNIVGSRCGSLNVALKLMKDRKVCPSKLIQNIHPFSNWAAAIDEAKSKGALKIQMTM